MKYFPYKDDGMFREDDFRWIRDWGFNWVRLPMDYRFWTDPRDHFKIQEEKVVPIDRAIRLGEKYGVHVNVCLHRAPGYCILDTMNESLTGIHITKETTDLFTDPKTQDAFVFQWTYFADRYKGISSEKLSFNLVNEPIIQPTCRGTPGVSKSRNNHAGRHFQQCGHASPRERLCSGCRGGDRRDSQARSPAPRDHRRTGGRQCPHTRTVRHGSYAELPYLQSHAVDALPVRVGARHPHRLGTNCPTWPLKDSKGKVVCDRSTLTHLFQPWGELAPAGVPIHFGEMGCYKHTPPQVVLAWFSDTLGVLSGLQTGWALWNFRGPFGVLDTERPGTKYENWHNHQLDRALLGVLQQNMKS